ncbi:DUF6585 family protein [Nocardia mexicana]|uniref:Uncharacterized protein n=1 Tax=Nocardia mexicana TaxID=279262 RepID=A0A370GSF2_9NOCA|nr:DUF6585 family protein [Nocardia mexicana]RDI46196.1 hypothetical protein DFR68_11297 [Nocardia mexicana]
MTTPSTQERETGGTAGRRTVPLSQLIYLMAEHDKLGEHRQTFLPPPMSGDTVVRGCALVAGGLVVVGGLCAAAGSLVGSGAVGALALVPAAAAFLRGRRNRGSRRARLDLFDYGMTVYRGVEKIVAFRWDSLEVRQQVIPFHNAAAAATDYSFTLTGPGNSTAAFDESIFDGAKEWGPAIQSAVTATQLPHVVAAIDSEQTIRFGDIAVDLNSLTFAETSYPWEHIQRMEAHHGLVCIKAGGQWISLVSVETIPNFYIFNEVTERLRLAALDEMAEQAAADATRSGDAAVSEEGAEAEQPSLTPWARAAAETNSTAAPAIRPPTLQADAPAARGGAVDVPIHPEQEDISVREGAEAVGVAGPARDSE